MRLAAVAVVHHWLRAVQVVEQRCSAAFHGPNDQQLRWTCQRLQCWWLAHPGSWKPRVAASSSCCCCVGCTCQLSTMLLAACRPPLISQQEQPADERKPAHSS
jgi:hypothetical protein